MLLFCYIRVFLLLSISVVYIKCNVLGRSSLSDVMETKSCMTPNNSIDLQAQALKLLYGRYISDMFKEMRKGINGNLKSRSSFVTKLSDTSSCPFRKNENVGVLDDGISEEDRYSNNYRSSCPNHVEVDFDANRIPEIINIVKCSCDQCIQSTGKRCGEDGSHCLQFTGNCSPILHSFPVVRRKCKTESLFYEYHAVLEHIPVGCTCKI